MHFGGHIADLYARLFSFSYYVNLLQKELIQVIMATRDEWMGRTSVQMW